MSKFTIISFIFFVIFTCFSDAVPRRLSQMEGKLLLPPVSNEKSPESPSSHSSEQNGACREGWENFEDKACFYGLKVKQGFFNGNDACRKLGANFTSIHSMAEFDFITSHWDLHHFWIGIIYGWSSFQDGTKVDPQVFGQFQKFVPWAFPSVQKGFICRASPGQDVKVKEEIASFEASNSNEDSVEHRNDGSTEDGNVSTGQEWGSEEVLPMVVKEKQD